MTREDKELLLTDLCARLPYMVRVKVDDEYMEGIHVLRGYEFGWFVVEGNHYDIDEVTPYLHPISSMTEEEQIKLGKLLGATSYNLLKGEYSSLRELLEYSYKNHIDLFGLIPKGLALEAPEDMYK